MIFSGFGHSGTGLVGGLGDSSDGLQMRMKTSQDEVFATGPTSSHASFVSSTSSFRDYGARIKQEHQDYLAQQQHVAPLHDTPHTPTNAENSTSNYNSTFVPARGIPMNTRPPMQYQMQMPPGRGFVSVKHDAQSLDTGAQEVESTELREFIAPGSNDTFQVLDDAKTTLNLYQQRVEELRQPQATILMNLCENLVSEAVDNATHFQAMDAILQTQAEYRAAIFDTLNALIEARKQIVFSTAEVERAYTLSDELVFTLANLDILTAEMTAYLAWIREGAEMPNLSKLTSLVIAKSPFPGIWMKRNQMNESDSIIVRLLHGCSVTLDSFSEIKVTILSHTPYTAKTVAAKPIIDNDTFSMDPATLTASIGFVYTAGSRKDVAQCNASLTIQGSCFATSVLINRGVENVNTMEMATLLSENSKPFIVITNECQYGETFGILFHKDVFEYQWMTPGANPPLATVTDELSKITTLSGGPLAEIPWPLFANAIQKYFVRASRQDSLSPRRGLSAYDLDHIRVHFFGPDAVSVDTKSFQKFWDWYGKVLHRLRYQRHVAAMWTEGLIFGMVGREGVCEQLVTRSPGTFLLRFSESSAGFIAVGYRVSGANAGIKNYLVKQEDTASATVKTLPDFIRSRPEFSVILQYTGQHLEDGFPVLYPIHKDFALKAYCVARPPKILDPKAGSPYDEL